MALNGIILHTSFTYILCYYANKVTLCGLQVAEIIYNDSPWYRFHLENQRMACFWIHRSQKTFYLDGNGIFHCSMETFQAVCLKLNYDLRLYVNNFHFPFTFQVIRTSFSYYIILKRIGS